MLSGDSISRASDCEVSAELDRSQLRVPETIECFAGSTVGCGV